MGNMFYFIKKKIKMYVYFRIFKTTNHKNKFKKLFKLYYFGIQLTQKIEFSNNHLFNTSIKIIF